MISRRYYQISLDDADDFRQDACHFQGNVDTLRRYTMRFKDVNVFSDNIFSCTVFAINYCKVKLMVIVIALHAHMDFMLIITNFFSFYRFGTLALKL